MPIGNYGLKRKAAVNNADSDVVMMPDLSNKPLLHAGIAEYQAKHRGLVEGYLHKYSLDVPADIQTDFFRNAFYSALTNPALKLPEIPEELIRLRETEPVEASITLEKFLGKQLAELYELALEEELNSKNYRDALLHDSTEVYAGDKWQVRPILFAAGPSACGKTYSAQKTLEAAARYLPCNPIDQTGNKVIYVDGGKCRSVSQIRKLVIKVANNKGYTGITDLHKKSKILENAKTYIYKHAMQPNLDCGVVIPETFSYFVKPSNKPKKMLEKAFKLPRTKVIFTRIVGVNDARFKDVVAFMGSSRAWKTKFDGTVKDLSELNEEPDCESKAYGANGFFWGVHGSELAEKWFKNQGQGMTYKLFGNKLSRNLTFTIKNDLELFKEQPSGSNKWIPASVKDTGVIKISQRVYEKWLEQGKAMKLTDFCNLPENRVPLLIYTSAKLEFINKRAQFQAAIQKITSEEQKGKFLPMLEQLFDYIDNHNIDNLTEIEYMQGKLSVAREMVTATKFTEFLTCYELQVAIDDLSDALVAMKHELASVNSNRKSIAKPQPIRRVNNGINHQLLREFEEFSKKINTELKIYNEIKDKTSCESLTKEEYNAAIIATKKIFAGADHMKAHYTAQVKLGTVLHLTSDQHYYIKGLIKKAQDLKLDMFDDHLLWEKVQDNFMLGNKVKIAANAGVPPARKPKPYIGRARLR